MNQIFLVYNNETRAICGMHTLQELLRAEYDEGIYNDTIMMDPEAVSYDHLQFYQYSGWNDGNGDMVFDGHILDVGSFSLRPNAEYRVNSIVDFAERRGYLSSAWMVYGKEIMIKSHVTRVPLRKTLFNWDLYYGGGK